MTQGDFFLWRNVNLMIATMFAVFIQEIANVVRHFCSVRFKVKPFTF